MSDAREPIGLSAFELNKSEVAVFVQLAFIICATVVGCAGSLKGALAVPGHEQPTNTDEIVFSKVIAGMSVTMIFGNAYFAWLALRLMRKEQRTDVCCLPYGINTPAAFVFIFGIIAPAVTRAIQEGKSPNDAAVHGWRVGCVANLVAGVVGILAGIVGPVLVKVAPKASLLIALAGIGFTWLGVGQILACFTAGYAGLAPLFVALVIYFGGINSGAVPAPVFIIVVGMLSGWVSWQGWQDGGSWAAVKSSFSNVGFHVPMILDADTFRVIPDVLSDDLAVILPVSLTGAVGTLLNVYSAEQAGDSYPLREVMIFDGIGTVVAGLFGSPLGTCVYIGHPAYKALGGKALYSVLNCAAFTFLAIPGLFALVQALVPPYAINPLVLFVGLSINQDAFTVTPSKQYPAAILGMFPAVAEWSLSFWSGKTSPLPDYPGLASLKKGALLIGLIWTSIGVKTIYRQFYDAMIWSCAAMFFAAIGLIHQDALDMTFKSFAQKPFGVSACSYTIGYMLVALIACGLWQAQKRGSPFIPPPEPEEDTDDSGAAQAPEKMAKETARVLTTQRTKKDFFLGTALASRTRGSLGSRSLLEANSEDPVSGATRPAPGSGMELTEKGVEVIPAAASGAEQS